MTFWAKLLTVVVFILSIVFASMSAVVFAKRQDYRGQLEKLQVSSVQDKKDFTEKLKEKDSKITALSTDLTQANTDKDVLKVQVAAKNAECDRIDGEMKKLNLTLSAITDLSKVQAEENGKLGTQVVTLSAAKLSVEKDRDDLFLKLRAANDRANALESEKTTLTAKLDTASKDLVVAQGHLNLDEEIFAELSRRNIEWKQIITPWATLPDIKAVVLTVDTGGNFVVLNKGKKDNVKNNYEFAIWRDGTFVATVNVFDVKDDMCAAHIVLLKDSKTPVQRGDHAWTRL